FFFFFQAEDGIRDKLVTGVQTCALPIFVGYTAPKVLWLRQHEPAAYAATQRMCLPHDFLNLWLSGTFATEPGDASGTAYFDVRRSEERRVGKECRARVVADDETRK